MIEILIGWAIFLIALVGWLWYRSTGYKPPPEAEKPVSERAVAKGDWHENLPQTIITIQR